jgi:ribosomal protein S18 acetylase RimI-like enzyme
MPLQVRDATPEDAQGIAPLLDSLGYPADPDTIATRLRELFAADPTGRVLVAVDEAGIVGFATLHSTPLLHRATSVGRITGIAVTPSVQGRGIGRALLRAAEGHFRMQGLARIEVTSGPLHTAAYPFYRRLGYTDHGVRFAKSLIEA